MFLTTTKVGPFKSIDVSEDVKIEKTVTALVGMNEAGKTIFLQALEKARDALDVASFDPVDDYPRKDLPPYLKQHKIKPSSVVVLTYQLTEDEVTALNDELGTSLKSDYSFSVTHKYDNKQTISIQVDEKPVLKSLVKKDNFSTDARAAGKAATSIRELVELLNDVTLTDDEQIHVAELSKRIASADKAGWDSVVEWETWQWLSKRVPKFLYFGDYDLLPSKVSLDDLAARVKDAESKPDRLEPKHRAVLALLRMADIGLEDFKTGGYEQLKAKIEGVSINLTDQVMEFWKQNEDLEVEIDIKPDSEDVPPYNSGPNLYLRIKNRRHRGVSTPFRQRSRGFIWFFSFLVWFDEVRYQLDSTLAAAERQLVLLLDEPGLSLHAMAQADFLRYIDKLAENHQVIYTTHSPFMVHSDRLQLVRVVEDKKGIGTVISDNVSSSDPRTIFPLQAALGWTIAQNLFISERNLLVEGPSDLIYLQFVSSLLESAERSGLRSDVTIVPVGGLDKVATFVALLGASGLKLAVLHDYCGSPDQRLKDLVKQKIIPGKSVLNTSQFRDLKSLGNSGKPTDTEDLFETSQYLEQFNCTFASKLGKKAPDEGKLPSGDRIIGRIERYLNTAKIKLRPSGGFNHYTVASHFASNPPKSLSEATLSRFEALFEAVNSIF